MKHYSVKQISCCSQTDLWKKYLIFVMLKKNPNIVDIKSVITEHPKISKKLSKTIGNGKKVSSNNSLYSDPKIQKNL